jgi:hypothetical protein
MFFNKGTHAGLLYIKLKIFLSLSEGWAPTSFLVNNQTLKGALEPKISVKA